MLSLAGNGCEILKIETFPDILMRFQVKNYLRCEISKFEHRISWCKVPRFFLVFLLSVSLIAIVAEIQTESEVIILCTKIIFAWCNLLRVFARLKY